MTSKASRVVLYISERLEMYLMLLFSFILLGSVLLQVISRQVGWTLAFTEETARYSFVWITFLSLGYGIKEKVHIRIDILAERLPIRLQNIIAVVIHIVNLVFMCWLLYLSIQYIYFVKNSRFDSLKLPIIYLTACMPIGFLFAAIRSLQMIRANTPSMSNTRRS